MDISKEELAKILRGRHLARTNGLWLARNVLGYSKMNATVHGPMTEFLTQFPEKLQGKDVLKGDGTFEYLPLDRDPANVLKGDDKRRLLLAPRGWYKTTLNVTTHSVQWILNFPDITIAWFHASQDLIEHVLMHTKGHFQYNPVMRYLFPEFCVPLGTKDWGTRSYFDIPCRKVKTPAPTLSCSGISSVRTGMHYHVMKFTDIVDKENSSRAELCNNIAYDFAMCENLLLSPQYWIDVEGTIYSYSDLYSKLVDEWDDATKKENKPRYKIFLMGCFARDVSIIGKEKAEFTPDEADLPFVTETVDKREREISLFPEEFTWESLNALRTNPLTGEVVFTAQQLNRPIIAGDVGQAFPLDVIKWKDPKDLAKIPFHYKLTTVDTAHTVNKRSKYTCITTCGWDRYNRCYVVDVRLGKWLPEKIATEILDVWKKERPRKIVIEETGFVTGLMPTVRRWAELTGEWPVFELFKRETDTSKDDRILGLQSWFKQGLIFFSTSLSEFVKTHITLELTRFPKFEFKDFLDTLADQFKVKTQFGPLDISPSEKALLEKAKSMLFRKPKLFAPEDLTSETTRDQLLGSGW